MCICGREACVLDEKWIIMWARSGEPQRKTDRQTDRQIQIQRVTEAERQRQRQRDREVKTKLFYVRPPAHNNSSKHSSNINSYGVTDSLKLYFLRS